MAKFLMIIISYVFGACIIQNICNSLSTIPLIDHHAWGIRNLLCIIWLIIVVVFAIFVPTDG